MANKIENIILASYTKIGDRVMMNVPPNQESMIYEPTPQPKNGELGTIVGYYEAFHYVDVITYPWSKPGKYRSNGTPYVLWDNGTFGTPSLHHVCFAGDFDNKILTARREDAVYRKVFETAIWIEELPKTKYMIGAVVELANNKFTSSFGKLARISRISYPYAGTFCDDGVTPYPIYQIIPVDSDGPSAAVNENDISQLVDPGNYFYWLQGAKDKLTFKDLKDEVRFYISIGKIRDVMNPVTKKYRWNLKDAVEAFKRGEVDIINYSQGFFRENGILTAKKINSDLEDLIARCRAEIDFDNIQDM